MRARSGFAFELALDFTLRAYRILRIAEAGSRDSVRRECEKRNAWGGG